MIKSLGSQPWRKLQPQILSQKGGIEKLIRDLLEEIHSSQSSLHAWVCIDEERALNAACFLDEKRTQFTKIEPLFGMPVGIKDIFDVEGLPTNGGIPGWSDRPAEVDAPIVGRLRKAGAVILGKTVTTALAVFDPPPTQNPWSPDHTPGGSSSGSAAALGSSQIAGALGSQTGGSLCRPASYCGVCAMKPTFGWLPIQGIIPVSLDLDHPGPMARSVEDLSDLFEAISGITVPQSPKETIRLGILQGMFADETVTLLWEHLRECQAHLSINGFSFVDVPWPGNFTDIFADHYALMARGAWLTHRERFTREPGLFPPRITELITKGADVTQGQVDRARSSVWKWKEICIGLLRDLDAFLLPGFHDFPPDRTSTGVPRFHAPWSFLGWPEVSFGTKVASNGLPMALQIVGRPHSDGSLLAIAGKIQDILGHPVLPERSRL